MKKYLLVTMSRRATFFSIMRIHYDSIYRTKHIFGVESVVVVTQKFIFLVRFLLKIARNGDYGLVADQHTYAKATQFEWREMFARMKALGTPFSTRRNFG